jgi:hypothetical protein
LKVEHLPNHATVGVGINFDVQMVATRNLYQYESQKPKAPMRKSNIKDGKERKDTTEIPYSIPTTLNDSMILKEGVSILDGEKTRYGPSTTHLSQG